MAGRQIFTSHAANALPTRQHPARDDPRHSAPGARKNVAPGVRVCVRTLFRQVQWSEVRGLSPRSGRNSLAHRGSGGKSGTKSQSASGAAPFSHRLVSRGLAEKTAQARFSGRKNANLHVLPATCHTEPNHPQSIVHVQADHSGPWRATPAPARSPRSRAGFPLPAATSSGSRSSAR